MYLKSLVMMLVFCGCGSAAVLHEPSLVQSENAPLRQWKLSGEPSQVYIDEHRTFRTEVVPLVAVPGSESDLVDWHLVRVEGGDEDIEGLVFLAKSRPHYDGVAYETNINGEPRTIFYSAKMMVWEYDPARGDPIWSVSDPEAPEVGAELLQRYYEQVDSGLQEKLFPSTRAGRERAQEAKLTATRAELAAACNLNTLTVNWSTVEKGTMNDNSISKICAKDLESVIDFCENYPNIKKDSDAIKKVRCDFSSESQSSFEERKLVIEGDELVYTTKPKGEQAVSKERTLLTAFGELDQVLEGAKSTLIFRHGRQWNSAYYEFDNRFYPIGQGRPDASWGFKLDRGIREASLNRRTWSLDCGSEDNQLPLTRVTGERRDRLLAKATFEKEAIWNREPYFLARDSHGTYYYVDRYREEFGGRHYRVFVGKRGMLKLTKLKGLVEDSEGTVFSTQKGDLRLIVNPKASATWIQGKKRSELTAVDPQKNRKLIYDELGVYLGENLGHICDE